jgi:hypothetical protein
MPDLGQELALRYAVALQSVSNQPARLVLEAGEQALEEPFGCIPAPLILNEDVQHHAVLVHCPPEIVEHAIDAQKHLIEVPRVTWLRTAPAKLDCELRTEPATPGPDALVRDGNARSARISSTSLRLRLNR